MSETLYRKYRPQQFADLVGQDIIRTTLLHQILDGAVAHAYLFTGPRGVGKTTTARLLAKAVTCLQRKKDGEPCGSCDACKEITLGRSLDVVELDAASHTGVDNIREQIVEAVRFTPVRLSKKVFIIDEVHMLSTSSFNALLKTLEEPPEHVMFILATTEISKVPATIISRCQRFDFRRLSLDILVARLAYICRQEGVEVDEQVLWSIARQAHGGGRDAETLLAQVLTLGGERITVEDASLVFPVTTISEVLVFLNELSRRDAPAAIAHINALVHAGVEMKLFLEDVVEWARKALLWKISQAPALLEAYPSDVAEHLKAISSAYTSKDAMLLLDLLHEAKILPSAIVQLPLELASIKFCLQGNAAMQEESKSVLPEGKPVQTRGPSPETRDGSVPSAQTMERDWDDIVVDVGKTHASLSLLLKNAKVCGMDGVCVRLGYQFKFHAEMINQPKSRNVVEQCLQRRYGSPVSIRGEYLHGQADAMVEEVLQELGGKVVDA